MPKVFRKLEIESVAWAASTLKTREMPLTVYKGLRFDLNTTHSGATPSIDELLAIIQKVELVANGQDTIVSVPGFHLYYASKRERGVAPLSTITSTAGRMSLFLPMALIRAISPQDTLLDARGLSSLTLKVTWAADIAGTATASAASLEINTEEYSNVPVDSKFGRHEFGYDIVNLDAASVKQFKLDVGSNNQYRRLWLYVLDGSDALANTEISKIGVKTRSFYYMNENSDVVQASNREDYNLAEDAGVYVIDFPSGGMMSERLDARALSELILEVTSLVTDGTLYIVKEKVIYA
jgi:hypothetical protein